MAYTHQFPVFEKWYRCLNWILDRCDRMPKHTRFTISGKIAGFSIDIAELITEAIYSKEKPPLLLLINKNLEKLRLFFRLCKDRKYLSMAQYAFIADEINEVGKMIGGWLKSLSV